MFDLSTTTNAQTMSSLYFLNNIINPAREAAGENSVESRKFNLKLKDELDDLGVAEYTSVTTSQGALRQVRTYNLNLEQMTLVGMRESKAVRRSVLGTLKKLQRKETDEEIMMRGYMLTVQKYEALQLENKQQAQELEEAAPKVKFVDNYVEAMGLLGFREVCKILGIKEYTVRDWLVSKGIIYKLTGKWAFTASWLDAKNGEHKVSYDAYGRAVTSIKFTPKGFAYIAQRISK